MTKFNNIKAHVSALVIVSYVFVYAILVYTSIVVALVCVSLHGTLLLVLLQGELRSRNEALKANVENTLYNIRVAVTEAELELCQLAHQNAIDAYTQTVIDKPRWVRFLLRS
jgi:hypothetical protein